MKLLVIGASGKTGQVLLQKLAHSEHEVTGLIRDPEQKKLVEQFNATALLGDLEKNMQSVVHGFDAIIFVAGSRGKNIQGVDYQGLINTVDAAIEANIKHFLYIGSINAGKRSEQFIQELKNYYQSIDEATPENLLKGMEKAGYQDYVDLKTLAEKHIRDSGINYTILRAGLLTLEEGSGKVSVTPGTLNSFGISSRENIADCFIECLNNPSSYQKTFTVLDGETLIENAFK